MVKRRKERFQQTTLRQLVEVLCAIIVMSIIIGNESDEAASITGWISLILSIVIGAYLLFERRFTKRVIIIWAVGIALSMINMMYVKQNAMQLYVYMLFPFFMVALFFYAEKRINYYLWLITAALMTLYLMGKWINSPNGYNIFPELSRNYLSVFFFELLIFVEIAFNSINRKVPMPIYIIFFVCCVLGVGRMGIITAGLSLVLIYIFRSISYQEKRNRYQMLKVFTLACVMLGGLFAVAISADKIATLIHQRFLEGHQASDLARKMILLSYFNRIHSVRDILLGVNTKVIPYLKPWGGNVHNAFLMLHASFGALGFAGALWAFMKTIIGLLKEGKKEFAVVLFCFFIRALTDDVFVGQIGMIIVWYCILYKYPRKKKRVMRIKV